MWGRALEVGRLAGIELRIDPSWFLVAALLTWSLATGYFPDLLPGAGAAMLVLAGLVGMLGLFGSLLLHELSHAVVARRSGIRVRSITLFLFGGVAEMASEPPSAGAEARVALAGPLASLALAAAAYGLWGAAVFLGAGPLGAAVLLYLALANLVLAVFNMLPAFPLDGGRVLRAFLWWRGGDLHRATTGATRVSRWIAYGLIAFGVLQLVTGGGALAIWPVLIALFILAAARSARVRSDVEQVLEGLPVSAVMRPDPLTADPGSSLQRVVDDIMLQRGLSYVPVVEDGLLLGEIDLAIIRKIDRDLWSSTRVDDVFAQLGPRDVAAPDDDAVTLFDRMLREQRRKFPVCAQGRLLGVVTMSDLLGRVQLAEQLARRSC